MWANEYFVLRRLMSEPALVCPGCVTSNFVLKLVDVLVKTRHEQEDGEVLTKEYLERRCKNPHVFSARYFVYGYEQVLARASVCEIFVCEACE